VCCPQCAALHGSQSSLDASVIRLNAIVTVLARSVRHGSNRPSACVFRQEKSPDLLALDEALTRLAELDRRKSQIVELRFFGGLNEVEAALVLGLSERTVRNDWKLAKAWLYRQVSPG